MLSEIEKNQLDLQIKELEEKYATLQAKGLNLDMTRGKPCAEQLDLSNPMITSLQENDYLSEDGADCRNYGVLEGLLEARRLFADLLKTDIANIIVAGNSSLNLMYDNLLRALLFPLPGSNKSWSEQGRVKFICPSPGYDRHFYITQTLGIEMVTVPMRETGPDMDIVEDLVAKDSSIKGMWSVPVYSNPDGVVYSPETCKRLAQMKTAAADFRIFWDNAYNVHHLYDHIKNNVVNLLELCSSYGNPNRVFEFVSTSKITFAGAGMAAVVTSQDNLGWIKKHMGAQTIGHDKIQQLRHVRFLKNADNIHQHMAKHAAILRPKFELVLKALEDNLKDCPQCRWTKPEGGYFISLYVYKGTAAEVVRLSQECGVAVTPAGSTYPYGKDPDDSNIRLAPSFPPLQDLESAVEVLCLCVKLATLRHIRDLSNK